MPRAAPLIDAVILVVSQVKGKVNAITLDKSSKTGLVFENVVASCEVVNSQSVEVQCTGLVPTVAIDKVDGCQVSLLQTWTPLVLFCELMQMRRSSPVA